MNDLLYLVLRALFSYFSLLFLTRLMGKREISQMTFFDYVVGISIGTIASSIAIEKDNEIKQYIPALLIFSLLQILLSFLSLKSKIIRFLVQGKSRVLIEKGKINKNNLIKERINIDELTSKLREKGVFKLEDVEYAYLETDGTFSVMKKSGKQSLTPNDININVPSSGIGRFIIEEGKINVQTLRTLGYTVSWLKEKLSQQSVFNIEEVMYAQVDETGKVFLDLYKHETKL